MDAIALATLISAFSALCVSILTHIRYSECGSFKLETKDEPVKKNENEENAPLLRE